MHFARGFAALIVVGNISFPVAVLAGAVDGDDEQRRVVCEHTEQTDAEPCREVAS